MTEPVFIDCADAIPRSDANTYWTPIVAALHDHPRRRAVRPGR